MSSMVCKETRVRVSSVLNRDVKQFGKQFMFDGDDETCWNSDQGTPQWITLEFPSPVTISELQVKFQGGFVGKECSVDGSSPGEQKMERLTDLYPDDINSLQVFPVSSNAAVTRLKLTFSSSTDFFGRITIYELNVIGNKES